MIGRERSVEAFPQPHLSLTSETTIIPFSRRLAQLRKACSHRSWKMQAPKMVWQCRQSEHCSHSQSWRWSCRMAGKDRRCCHLSASTTTQVTHLGRIHA